MSMVTMTHDAVPIANPRAVPLVAGRTGDIPVLDFGTRSIHVVNPTAAALLLSCDGRSSVRDIAGALAADFDVDPAQIVVDVERGFDGLRHVGLVRMEGDREFGVPALPTVVDGPGERRYPDVMPCTCGTGIEHMPWEPTFSVSVGELQIGVRTNRPATDAAARSMLDGVVAAGPVADPDAPPKFSLSLLDQPEGGPGVDPTFRNGLFEDQQWLVLSPDDDWLLRWLATRVLGWRTLGPTEVRLAALGIVGPRGVCLVPWMRGGDSFYVTEAANRDLELVLSPVFVETTTATATLGSSAKPVPVVGALAYGEATKRMEPDEALLPLLGYADIRPDDDLEQVADGLERLAGQVPVVEVASTDAATVAAALVRPRDR